MALGEKGTTQEGASVLLKQSVLSRGKANNNMSLQTFPLTSWYAVSRKVRHRQRGIKERIGRTVDESTSIDIVAHGLAG